LKKLEERAAAIGSAAQRRRIAQIERALTGMGIKAEARVDGIAMSGKRLAKHWLSDASLRFITGLTR
jgi:hypothetical protein